MEEYTLTDEATISRIADIIPRAMSAYFLCIYAADSDGQCNFKRDEIINKRIRSWTKFKNDIRALASIYILNFLDRGDVIDIEMIPQEPR